LCPPWPQQETPGLVTPSSSKVLASSEASFIEVASSTTCDISGLIACGGVGSLLKIEGESSAELDDSSLPPLVLEGKILVLASFRFFIVIN
jgi:hypothetical protein